MSEKQRARRTWTAFGDVRRLPSEYEIVTHETNWTARKHRSAPLEASPASSQNLWMLAARDRSRLAVDDWSGFRDPDEMTYRRYVADQAEQESMLTGILDEYAQVRHDQRLAPAWRATLLAIMSTSRFPCHALQLDHAYMGGVAPTSYITNCAAFAAADMLRRVSILAYRTRELQVAWPDDGFGVTERQRWEVDASWQPAREALERSLIAFDWDESFVAVDLVLRPTLDDILVRQVAELARLNGDDETWLLLSNLHRDVERHHRWAGALAKFAIEQNAANAEVLAEYIDRWAPRADAAAAGLAELLAVLPETPAERAEVLAAAAEARRACLGAAGLDRPGDPRVVVPA